MPGKLPRKEITCVSGLILTLFLSACGILTAGEPGAAPPAETRPIHMSDGTSTQAEVSPSQAPAGGPDIPGPTPCGEESGRVQAYLIDRGGQELSGTIYTPPCYGSNLEESYPVLYLLHGATETDSQWLDLGIAAEADGLIARGEIPPLVIVLPREQTWIALPDNTFGDTLVGELVPWVDQEFRTLADRESRAIGGLSRGGNWAVRLGLMHWGLFGSIGAHSTPLFYGDLERIPRWVELIPSDRAPRLYLDIGQADSHLPLSRKLDAILTQLDYSHEWHLNPGLHDQTYWESHLGDYLLWYSAGWEELLP